MFPRLEDDLEGDIAVIGAGSAGLAYPGELARHVAFQSWFRYQALRDERSRAPAISLWISDHAMPTPHPETRRAVVGSFR